MAKRIFISFAIEDKWARDYLRGQARNENSPFDFVDMSAKEPWDEKWKTNCRSRIKGCNGVIALVSKNTANADGQLWEIKCAKEENIRIKGIYTTTDKRPTRLPSELNGVPIVSWTWSNIESFVDSL
ncbi:MAG: TIR domain-containing protein [Sedimentisphaerales bacterium]|nr:TIR domain-containing protein [Sedimentisphaerales bacterium]